MAHTTAPAITSADATAGASWASTTSMLRVVRPEARDGHQPGPVLAPAVGPGQPQPHSQRALDQVRGFGQADPGLTFVGGGHQHRQDLVFVVAPERPGVARQRPPVPSLQACLISHASTPNGFRGISLPPSS